MGTSLPETSQPAALPTCYKPTRDKPVYSEPAWYQNHPQRARPPPAAHPRTHRSTAEASPPAPSPVATSTTRRSRPEGTPTAPDAPRRQERRGSRREHRGQWAHRGHQHGGTLRVPQRRIALTNGDHLDVYDTSGPYTDPSADIAVERGLPPTHPVAPARTRPGRPCAGSTRVASTQLVWARRNRHRRNAFVAAREGFDPEVVREEAGRGPCRDPRQPPPLRVRADDYRQTIRRQGERQYR